jgi:hypothetical protein
VGFYDERTGGLVTYLKSVSAITDLVGAGTAARIYPDQAKQGVSLPYLVYTRGPGGEVFRHLTGHTGARLAIVHLYCWGNTRASADALCEACKQNLRAQRTTMTGVIVNYIFVDDPQDDGFDFPFDGSDNKQYWSRLVLRIVHAES